ncbi:MAG: YitT family protein [Acutalibacteraceae bacterium]|nr:YitT family protein [Acutalibacteraceae bacterium]
MIILGGALYAISTVLFIFPHSLLLGGTSGISVILYFFLSFSPANILMIINFSLIIIAFLVLGKSMGLKTFVGSTATTILIGVFEKIFNFKEPIIQNTYISAVIGAVIIAIASGIMFYVGSSSGGTDVIALIIQKFSSIKIGKALLITDVLIVIVGGFLSNTVILISSFIGLIVKTFGVDFVISQINKLKKKTIIHKDKEHLF